MVTESIASLVDALRQYRLLDPTQLEEVARSLQARFPGPKLLASELIRLGWLTPYQANQLLRGRGQELLLGSHVLLEKLGEGGMGAVFKARNWKLGRVVALKRIRKERLDNPDAVRRFQREVRAAAALDHLNIVHALDADEIAGTHLLVMEYVEGGIDLSQLVRKQGPLPVAQACEYVRQAALGLQHAYERGLVHRDIKPANLLLAAGGVVKVLDMGLARLDVSAADDDRSSTMTQEGAVMGTPDYIAPEQAMESHTVDIRADLYSLGCTFYYLLTGRVPFPGGSMMEKLLKHRLEEPRPVEQLRPDVPTRVAGVVRKLMAKRPEARYQTPAEVLAALVGALGANVSDCNPIAVASQPIAGEASSDTFASAVEYMAMRDDTVAVNPPQGLGRNEERRLLYGMLGGSLVFLGLVTALVLLLLKSSGEKKPLLGEQDHPVVTAAPAENAQGKVDDAWIKSVAALPAEKQVKAVAAKVKELNPEFDGKVTHKVEEGVVTELRFLTDQVTDISPVRALSGLRKLYCSGSMSSVEGGSMGKLADLLPLKGMKLTTLWCSRTQVSDLSPLKGMKLTNLWCDKTQVSDLSPLKGMKLTTLNCGGTMVSDLSLLKEMTLTSLQCWSTPVSDLSPLKDMKLTNLLCSNTQVSDLSPLAGMKLTFLNCKGTKVTDLFPLKGMALKELKCDFKAERDAEVLRSIKTLETINDRPAKEFWKELDAKKP